MTDIAEPEIEAEPEAMPSVPLEFRNGGVVENVQFPQRTMTIVAVPYDEDAMILRAGRPIVESIASTAFAGVQRRHRSVHINRDHDITRPCGTVTALHPNDPRGLVADVRISRGALGDETLELANDGILGPSIGFAPMPGGESWLEGRSRRRVTKAYLGHIALVADPAYVGAQVLDVRGISATPYALSSMLPPSWTATETRSSPTEVTVTYSEPEPLATPLKDAALARLTQMGFTFPK